MGHLSSTPSPVQPTHHLGQRIIQGQTVLPETDHRRRANSPPGQGTQLSPLNHHPTTLGLDTKGCYIEARGPHGMTGCVGINLSNGTPTQPYSWAPNTSHVTENGLTHGSSAGPLIEQNLVALLETLARAIQEIQDHQQFNPEEACKKLHEYLEKMEE